MKKLLKYLVNMILFFVLWGIQITLIVGLSFQYIRVGPSGPIAFGGIIALFISYALVKKINKSNLWSNMFDNDEDKSTPSN